MITFVVQNETHALNFSPIVDGLLRRGVKEEELQVIHLDPIFGMHTADLIQVPNQKVVEIKIPAPYYRLSRIRRFFWLVGATNRLKRCVEGTTVLIVGSDGGIQRLMANKVRKDGGKAILLLDGLLHPWPRSNRVKHIALREISKFLSLLRLNHLFPADVGHSGLDWIFVMNQYVKSLLISQGVKSPIEVITLPRFDNYLYEFNKLRPENVSASNHLLYATGAYKWHGLYVESIAQEQDIADLINFANEHPDWRVRIRVHPREDRSDYSLQWPSNIELTYGSAPVLSDLAWASILVTARSTMAAEAEMVGLPVLIYTRNFGEPSRDSYFGRNEYFLKSDDLSDVVIYAAREGGARSRIIASIQSSVPKIVDSIISIYNRM